MKLRLPHKFQTALMAALASVSITTLSTATAFAEESPLTFGDNLGDVMYIGDSITHGVNSGSYRWSLFQILADNGVAHNDLGPLTNNWSGGIAVGTLYAGQTFTNSHAAVYGSHAYEISDTAPTNCPNSNRNDTKWAAGNSGQTVIPQEYANTYIGNWLGLDSTKRATKGGGTYTGDTYNPDTFMMMIGTNDILTDAAGAIMSDSTYAAAMASVLDKLLGATQSGETFTFKEDAENTGSVVTIWKAMAEKNRDADIVFLSVPTLGANHNNADNANIRSAILTYNAALEQWCGKHGVTYVQSDTGIVDVSNTAKPGVGVSSMYQDDQTHPSFQGDLIIAGNVAKAMGYAGRSVGLDRVAAATEGWTTETNITVASGTPLLYAENTLTYALGYTVDFNAVYGDGEANGWDNTSAFSIRVGDGTHSGTLSLTEAYVKWGDTILYSKDNFTTPAENLRIAYVNSGVNASDGVTAGYYVWLGDQLIGEGLNAGEAGFNGISLSTTGADATVSTLSWTDTAYAPTTEGYVNDSAAFHLVQVNPSPSHDNPTKQGIRTDITWTATTDKYALPSGQSSEAATIYREISTTVGNNYTGAANAAYNGDIGMRYAGDTDLQANYSVISVFNVTVTGNVYMQLDNPNTVYKSWTVHSPTSVIASFGGGIGGSYTVVYNAGIFDAAVRGGTYQNHTIGNGSHSYVNGGTFKAGVFGGGVAGTITGGTTVTVTGGDITGGVYGGGVGGTINGGTLVTITGGNIRGGVHGRGTAGTINDGTAVVIEGNLAHIEGDIDADTVTLRDVAPSEQHYTDGFDYYGGTIRADKVVLHHYTVEQMLASLETKSLVLSGGTATTIRDLTLTACEITAQDTSAVTLDGTLTLGNTTTYSGNVTLTDGMTIKMVGGENTSASASAQGGYRGGNWEVMKLAEDEETSNLTVHADTLVGAGMLQGSTFTYNGETGLLSAEGTDYSTYYLEGSITSVNLTTEQAAHAELQHVVLNAAAGTVTVDSGASNTLADITKQASSALTLNVAGSLTLSGTITGTGGSIEKTGAGTVTLNGASRSGLSDSITVSAGSLVAAVDNSLTSGTVTVDENGTLVLKTYTGMPTISGTGTVQIDFGNGKSYEYHNQSFLEQFTGTVELVSGNLQIGGQGNKFANATLKLSGGELRGHGNTFTHDIILAGGSIADAGANETYSGNITMEADSYIGRDGGDKAITLTGSLTGEHTLGTRGGNNATFNLNGETNIAGLLVNNGTVNINNTTTLTQFVAGMNGNTSATVNIAAGKQLHITGTAASDSNDNRTKGSFLLSHWPGSTTLNINGTMVSEAVISSWDGTPTINVNSGGLLELHQGLTRNYNSNSGQSRDDANHKVTLNVKSGGVLSVGNTPTGDTATHAGLVVNLEDGSKLTGYYASGVDSVAVYQNLGLAQNASVGIEVAQDKAMTVSSVISGNGGSLVKTGAGTLTLSGANTFTGGLSINGGTVKMGNTKALGQWNNSRLIQVNEGGVLDYNGVEADTTGYRVTLNGGTLTNGSTGKGSGKRQVVTSLVLTANSTVDAAHEMGIIAGGYDPTSINMGGHTLEKTGASTFYLTNTTISNGGTIKVSQGSVDFNVSANDSQLGSLGANLELAGGNVGGNKVKLANDITVTASGNGGTLSAAVLTETHNLTLAGDADLTVSGAISGSGAIAKTGTGTATISGSTTGFTGGLAVDAGKLVVNHDISVSSVTSDGTTTSGGVLDVAGTLTVNTDDVISFDGTLALNGLTLQGQGMFGIANISRLGSTIQAEGGTLYVSTGTYDISGIAATASTSTAPIASGYADVTADVQFIYKNGGTFMTYGDLDIIYNGVHADTVADDGSVHFEGKDYSTYYLKGEGDSLNLTQEQGDHPELQTVMVNASGSVSLSDTRSLRAVYQDAATVLTLTGGGELTVGSFGLEYGLPYANVSIDAGTSLVTDGMSVAQGQVLTINGEGTYNGGAFMLLDNAVANLGADSELASLSVGGTSALNISGETTVSGTTDLSNAASSTGVLTVKASGTLNVNGNLWGRNVSHLYLEQGGTVNISSNLTIVGAGANAELVAGTNDVKYSLDSGDWTFKNSLVTANADIAIGNKFENSTLDIGSHNVSLTNVANLPNSLTVTGDGYLTLLSGADNVNLKSLTVKNLKIGRDGSHNTRLKYNGNSDLSGVQHLYFDGGQLWLDGKDLTYAGDVTFNTTAYTEGNAFGGAAMRVGNNATFAGAVDVNQNTKLTWGGDKTVEFAGVVTGSGNLDLARYGGNGTFKISGDATGYTGAITSHANVSLNVAPTGSLNLAGGTSLAGGVSLDGTLTMNGATGTTSTISGAVSGIGTLATAATNAGTVNVTGAMGSFNGTISAQGGELNLTGSTITTHAVTVGEGATLNIGSAGATTTTHGTISNSGTLTLTGNIFVDAGDVTAYKLAEEGTEKSYTGQNDFEGSGYLISDNKYFLVENLGGMVTSSAANFTHEGIEVTTREEDGSLVFSTGSTHGTVYYINKALSYNQGEMSAATGFNVAEGVTFTASGSNLADKTLTLNKGSILSVSATTYFATSQIANLNLTGDATVNLNQKRISIQRGGTSYLPVEIALNGHTLNITGSGGDNYFGIVGNCTVDSGTIALNGTRFMVGHSGKGGLTVSAPDTLMTMANGSSLVLAAGNSISLKALNMVGNGSGSIAIDSGTTAGNLTLTPDAGQQYTFKGTAQLSSLTLNGSGTQVLDLTGNSSLGKVAVNSGSLVLNATNFNGTISQADGASIVLYGNAGQLANEDARIQVTKKAGNQLSLEAGSEKAISKVTVQNGSTEWLLVGKTAENAEGLYTDIDIQNTNTSNNGLIVRYSNTTSHIGSLSAVSANTHVRGDYTDQDGNRVLAVHQNDDTTFAGYFMHHNTTRDVALAKYGTGTLTLTGANAAEKAMDIYEGAIALAGSGKWVGATTVHNGGTLSLANNVTTLYGDVTVDQGGTLVLTRKGADAVSNTGKTLTLNSGAVVDLSTLGLTGEDVTTVALATGGTFVDTNLDGVSVNLGAGAIREGKLAVENSNLVLTYANVDLIWDNAAGDGQWSSSKNWHTAASAEVHTGFLDHDNVSFEQNATVTLGGNVVAGSVNLGASSVTINTAAHDLTADSLASAGGKLSINGGGTATFGEGELNLTQLFTTGGTTIFEGKVSVNGADTSQYWARFQGNAELRDGLSFSGSSKNDYALLVENNSTVTLHGDTNVAAYVVGASSGSKLVLEENATLSAKSFLTSSTISNNGTLEMKSGSVMTLNGGVLNASGITSNGGTLVLKKGSAVSLHAGSFSPIQVFSLGNVVLGDLSAPSASDTASITTANSGHGGTVKLDSIAGTGTLTLKANSGSTARNTFSIGGSATESELTKFHGTLALECVGTGANRVLLAEFNDKYSAADAVVQATLSGTHNSEAVGILINSNVVQMKGLKDGSNITSANSYALASGSASRLGTTNGNSNQYLNSASDGTFRTLEFTGSAAADSYTTAIKVLSGVNLTMSGAGSQTFTGDLSAMNGAVTVNSGTLTLSNSGAERGTLASVTVTGGSLVLNKMNVAGAISVTEGAKLDLGQTELTHAITTTATETVEFTQDITANGLGIDNRECGIDLEGNKTNGLNFFAGTEDYLTVVTGGGTVVTNGHKVTQGGTDYLLEADGTASSVEKEVGYTYFYQLEAKSTLNYSDIFAVAVTGHGADQLWVQTAGATLNVDRLATGVILDNGTVNMGENGSFVNGGGLYIHTGDANMVKGQIDIAKVMFASDQTTATLFTNAPVQNGGVRLSSGAGSMFGGVEVDAYAASGASAGSFSNYSIGRTRFTVAADEVAKVENGDVSVKNGVYTTKVHNSADGVTGKLTLDSGVFAQYLDEVVATSGDVEFNYMAAANGSAAAAAVSLSKLEIGAGKVVGFYEAAAPTSMEEMVAETSVTVTGTLTAGQGAKLNANLVMEKDSVLDVSASNGVNGLLMGSSVTLKLGETLSETTLAQLPTQLFTKYDLYSGVDTFYLEDFERAEAAAPLEYTAWVDAHDYFTNVTANEYFICYSGAGMVGGNGGNVGTVYLYRIPEPTTSTLSLLALAALAARRRKH